AATISTILPQLTPQDRLLVIADNCTDATAEIARNSGASAIERHDTERKGKGYALDFGLTAIASDPPEVIIMVDADCICQPDAIDKLARVAMAEQRPVQATYLMEQPPNPTPKDSISALAFLVKNLVRPSGLKQLGFPSLLTGTGMAFPWLIIRDVPLASSNIVEDMQMSLDLAIAGHPTVFCPEARVTGCLPQQEQVAKTQRTRWEHGHLQTLLTQTPRLATASIEQQRFDLMAIALDLAVPPLSLLVAIWLATFAASILAAIIGASAIPAILLGVQGLLILVSIVSAWAKFGRADISGATLLSVPFYILWKIPLYLGFILKRQTKWVRTERDV
ncbi:MAG: glycosyltransferase, partial [Oscillatoriales cyanobacterium]